MIGYDFILAIFVCAIGKEDVCAKEERRSDEESKSLYANFCTIGMATIETSIVRSDH